MNKKPFPNFETNQKMPAPDKGTQLLLSLIDADFFCESIEEAEKLAPITAFYRSMKFYPLLIDSKFIEIWRKGFDAAWGKFLLNVFPCVPCYMKDELKEILTADCERLNFQRDFNEKELEDVDNYTEIAKLYRLSIEGGNERNNVSYSIIENWCKQSSPGYFIIAASMAIGVENFFDLMRIKDSYKKNITEFKRSYCRIHVLIYSCLKEVFNHEFYKENENEFVYYFQSAKLKKIMDDYSGYEIDPYWYTSFYEKERLGTNVSFSDGGIVCEPSLPFNPMNIIIGRLFDACIESFSCYSNDFISLGQLYIGVCFNCGKLMSKKRIRKKFHSDSCRRSYNYQKEKE